MERETATNDRACGAGARELPSGENAAMPPPEGVEPALAAAERAVLAAEAEAEVFGARIGLVTAAIATLRARAIAAGVRLTGARDDERPSPERAEKPTEPRLYYAVDDRPPMTSERAFRRAIADGLPVTPLGGGLLVVTVESWRLWVQDHARPCAKARQRALPSNPTNADLLGAVGAKPRRAR
jgi:hypothetical protein